MDAEKPRRRWWRRKRAWAAVLLWLAASYPLSLGPALYSLYRGWVSPETFDAAYWPMFWGEPAWGGPVPWWPEWYREEYIGRFEVAGMKARDAEPAWQEMEREMEAEFEAGRRKREAEANTFALQTDPPSPTRSWDTTRGRIGKPEDLVSKPARKEP